MTVPVQCAALYQQELFTGNSAQRSSSTKIPQWLKVHYTLNGKIRYVPGDEAQMGNTGDKGGSWQGHWTEGFVDDRCRAIANGTWFGLYGRRAAVQIVQTLSMMHGRGKHVLVVGSQTPWVECILLNEGAAHVTTIGYGGLVSTHPRVRVVTLGQFAERFLNQTLPQFDGVVAFSPIEYLGLGRLGDVGNPYGDIITVALMWCAVRPQGFMVLGLPTAGRAPGLPGRPRGVSHDMLVWNSHRIYGNVRWPFVTQNWKAVALVGEFLNRQVYTFLRLAAPLQ